MNKTDYSQVSRLLESFDAVTLGEGDLTAGANTLAAMVISIANISRPGSCLMNKEEAKLDAGTSLLITGSLSASLTRDKIINGLATRQNNVIAHLRDWQLELNRQAAMQAGTRQINPVEYLARGASTALLDLEKNMPFPGGIDEALAMALIMRPEKQGKHDLHQRPSVFVTATKPAELEKSLQHAHLGQALVHIGITNDPARSARLDDCCSALMDGGLTVGPLLETVRGHIIATDPLEALAGILRYNGQPSTWLACTVWLTDSKAGPEPDTAAALPAGKRPVKLNAIQARYDAAMDLAWARRLDYNMTDAVNRITGKHPIWVKPYEFAWFQFEWMAFLKDKESEFPGITGAARSLLATLIFGLEELMGALPLANGFTPDVTDVAAFARYLVLRMINTRAAIIQTAREARLHALATNLTRMLADRPHRVRDLTRRAHRLPAADCLDALHLLKARGGASCDGDLWSLTPAACTINLQSTASHV